MAQLAVLAVMAVSALNKGAQERKQAYAEAEGLRDAANRTKAAATAEVSQGQRLKEHMYSRALLVSAASGGGTDAGVVNILGDLNAEGDYRIYSKLYVGADEATGLQYQSEQAMKAGDAAQQASYVSAAKTVISSAAGGGFGTTKMPDWDFQDQSGGMEVPGYAPQGMNA